MGFSEADLIAMQARLDRNKAKHTQFPPDDKREVGTGGIQSEIEDYLKSLGRECWYDVKRSDKRTTSRLGVPDFVIFYKGKCVGMEVKRKGNKPTVEQLGELMWMECAGAKTAVVYSKDEAVDFLKSL